jgi:hypothetical protein
MGSLIYLMIFYNNYKNKKPLVNNSIQKKVQFTFIFKKKYVYLPN